MQTRGIISLTVIGLVLAGLGYGAWSYFAGSTPEEGAASTASISGTPSTLSTANSATHERLFVPQPKVHSRFSSYYADINYFPIQGLAFEYCMSEQELQQVGNALGIDGPLRKCVNYRTYYSDDSLVKEDESTASDYLWWLDELILEHPETTSNYLTTWQQVSGKFSQYLRAGIAREAQSSGYLSNLLASRLKAYATINGELYLSEELREFYNDKSSCLVHLGTFANEVKFGYNTVEGKFPETTREAGHQLLQQRAEQILGKPISFDTREGQMAFHRDGIMMIVYDRGESRTSCNYQFVNVPYKYMDMSLLYPDHLRLLQQHGYYRK